MVTVNLPDVDATEALGRALASEVGSGSAVILLEGPLGAGKTAFARGFLRGRGIEGTLASPTYALVHAYPGGVHHADVYRVADLHELEQTGILDEVERGTWLIEWASLYPSEWPADHLEVRIDPAASGRTARIVAAGPRHATILEGLCLHIAR